MRALQKFAPPLLRRGVLPVSQVAVVDTDLLLHTVFVIQGMTVSYNAQGTTVGLQRQPLSLAQSMFETSTCRA